MAKEFEEDEDDDFEFELEEVDPEIKELARQRAVRQIEETEARAARIETFEQPSQADPITIDDFSGFRFTTRHLLIATGLLAVFMSMGTLSSWCNATFFSGLGALAFGWWFVLRKERVARLEREKRRKEVDERLASMRKNEKGEPIASTVRSAEIIVDLEEDVPEKPALSFSFSLKQILVTFAIAAVILTIASFFGADSAALLLGVVAVLGLAVQVIGIEMPGIIVFGWWILIVLYVVISIASLILGRGAVP